MEPIEALPVVETSLHKNPFWLLSATTRDDRKHIVDLAEERSLILDPEVCQRARADLINPRNRLSAEISWFPGVSPNRARQIASALGQAVVGFTLDSGLPPLARTNVLSAALEILPEGLPANAVVDRIVAIAKSAEEIDARTVQSQVNEDRLIAKFPPVTSTDVFDEEIAKRFRDFRNSIKSYLDRLSTEHMLKIIHELVDTATGHGKHQAPSLIEDLIDSYETEAQGFIQAEAKTLEHLLTRAKNAVKLGEREVGLVLDDIWKLIDNWNKVVKPIQIIAKTRGADHPKSREIAAEIRSFGIDLHNEHDMPNIAKTVTDQLKVKFSVLPQFSDRIGDDLTVLEQSRKELAKSEEQKKEWEREITYSADVGVLNQNTLKISPSGVQWKRALYPIESITRIRWGATRHSVNGIPTGTTYAIYIADANSEISINLRNGEVYSSFIDKLWRAVGVRLAIEHLARLKAGEKIRFGDATIEDEGVTLPKHKFMSREPVRLNWHQVHVWSADGSFIIGAKDDKKTYAALPYLTVSNVVVLEQLIRASFKSSHRLLSSALD